MIKAGVVGAAGYMGGEALRVLLDHPQVEISWLTSRSGGAIGDHHPYLFGLDMTLIDPSDITPCDVAFLESYLFLLFQRSCTHTHFIQLPIKINK